MFLCDFYFRVFIFGRFNITAYHHNPGPCAQNKHAYANLRRMLGLEQAWVFWGLDEYGRMSHT